eukprot:327884-Pyramimonas_sp.AAC.1
MVMKSTATKVDLWKVQKDCARVLCPGALVNGRVVKCTVTPSAEAKPLTMQACKFYDYLGRQGKSKDELNLQCQISAGRLVVRYGALA